MRTPRGRALLLLTVGIATLLLGSGTALADGSQQQAAPAVLVDATATPTEDGQVEVSMQFANAQGQAASGQEVSFFLETDFLGQSLVSLGSAATNASGKAQVRYLPTWNGTQRVLARLAGGQEYSASETTIEFDVAGTTSAYHAEPPALGMVRKWLPLVIGAVVLLVWATMALVVVRTTYGIMAAGQRRSLTALRYPVRAGVVASTPLRRQPREQLRRQPGQRRGR